MLPIEERKRDLFFTEEAYNERLEFAEAMFNGPKFVEDRAQIKEKFDAAGARQVSFYRMSNLIEDIWMRYSAGDPLAGMRERVRCVFEGAWPKMGRLYMLFISANMLMCIRAGRESRPEDTCALFPEMAQKDKENEVN